MKNRKRSFRFKNQLNIFLSILFLLFLTIPIKVIAKRKKTPNCLRSIVLFSNASGNKNHKKAVIGTGFIIYYNDKLCVATNLDIIQGNLKPEIITIDGNELKYRKRLIPNDKRNIVLFELDPETPDDIYKSLELETDVSVDTDINDKVLTFGCKSNWETITSSGGKITGLGPVNIEIDSEVPYNMNGGPVISVNSGKVIAVLSKLSSYIDEKNYKSKYCKGIRIDSIKEMKEFDEDEFSEDQKKLKEKEAVIQSIHDKYTEFSSEIDKLHEKIKSGYGTRNSTISKLKEKHQEDVKKIKSTVAQIKDEKIYSMQYFQLKHNQAVSSAEKKITQFIELEKSFDNLEKENKKAAAKANLKGVDLKLDIDK